MKNIFKTVSLNNIMFRKKMLLIYLIGIFLPTIVISGFYCVSIRERVKAANIQEIRFDVDVTANAVERVIDKARMISDEIYFNVYLNKSLLTTDGSIKEYLDIADEISNLKRYSVIYDFIEQIQIYSFNDKLYRSDVLMWMSDVKVGTLWYERFAAMNTDYAVISYYDEATQKSCISIVRILHNYGRCNDILKIDISYAAIANEMIYNEDKGRFYLFNEENICIAVSGGGDNAEYIGTHYEQLVENDRTIEQKLQLPVGYTMYCEYENGFAGNVATEILWFMLLIGLVLIVSAVMVYITTCSMTEKMRELTDSTRMMQSGKFVKISEDGIGNDEVGALTRGFNAAVDKINMLINEVYNERVKSAETEKERSKAEFIALQRQINPHFLFNILEILRMRCVKNNNSEIAGIIKNLSVMLRSQISWKKDIITFEEEMVFANAFIELCKCNFDNEIATEIEIDETISKCLIPKMSVHVFVENAFRHGLDSLAQNRAFAMRAYREGDRLTVKVSDNGKGMDKCFVDAINSGDIESIKAMSGDGIANVFARLRLYFDNDFNISVTSVPFDKTEITMRLPVNLYDKEWSE